MLVRRDELVGGERSMTGNLKNTWAILIVKPKRVKRSLMMFDQGRPVRSPYAPMLTRTSPVANNSQRSFITNPPSEEYITRFLLPKQGHNFIAMDTFNMCNPSYESVCCGRVHL